MPLTENQAKNAKPLERAYKLADSEGLFLLVQPYVRLDAGVLAVFDECGDHRPVVAALVGACEQSIFEVEGERTDGALDGVVVEIDAAIVQEAYKAVPARERVADRLAETAFGTDLSAACFE